MVLSALTAFHASLFPLLPVLAEEASIDAGGDVNEIDEHLRQQLMEQHEALQRQEVKERRDEEAAKQTNADGHPITDPNNPGYHAIQFHAPYYKGDPINPYPHPEPYVQQMNDTASLGLGTGFGEGGDVRGHPSIGTWQDTIGMVPFRAPPLPPMAPDARHPITGEPITNENNPFRYLLIMLYSLSYCSPEEGVEEWSARMVQRLEIPGGNVSRRFQALLACGRANSPVRCGLHRSSRIFSLPYLHQEPRATSSPRCDSAVTTPPRGTTR